MSEAELKEYHEQLESVEAALKADPDNSELQSLINELKEIIALTEDVLAETTGSLKPPPKAASYTPQSTAPSSGSPYTRTSPDPEAPPPASHIYSVGDPILARWTSGDNALYPAKITSVLGSQKNPVYLVKFTQYNVTEQLGPKDIRPTGKSGSSGAGGGAAGGLKRKADGTAAGAVNGLPPGAIISQPASINAEAAEQRKKEVKAAIGGLEEAGGAKKKGRKLEQKKVLDEGKRKWQEFAAKGVKGRGGKTKKIGEGSMFRTPDSVNGRVGFTGSGQAMRKDAVRGKHIYQHGEDDE